MIDLDITSALGEGLGGRRPGTVAQLRSAIADAGSPEEFQDRVHDFGEVAMAETLEGAGRGRRGRKAGGTAGVQADHGGTHHLQPRAAAPDAVRQRAAGQGRGQRGRALRLQFLGMEETAEVADRIKALGFRYATLSGITMAVSDLEVPADKGDIILEAQQQELQLEAQYNRG